MKKLAGLILLVAFASFYFVADASARSANILIASGSDQSYHDQIIKNLSTYIDNPDYRYTTVKSDQLESVKRSDYDLIITVGYEAADAFINNDTKTPVISLLIPETIFKLLLNKKVSPDNYKYFSCIFINQPVYRNINLIRAISRNFKTVGVLLGEQSKMLASNIESTITAKNLKPLISVVNDKTNLIQDTRNISKHSDVLLAIADSTIYNRRSIKGILLTTYRNHVPVIGYSKNYVKAGALAAVYSDEDQIAQHAAEVINELIEQDRNIPKRVYPKYFSVETNEKVAYSLNIKIPDSRILENVLQRNEKQ